jgi:hypothetical protein
MKVNQIVSEHKKGVRAMKYTTKTKGTVPVYGPDSKDAKLKPVKPVGTNEAIEVKPMPGASQISVDGKPIATTDAATAQVISQAAEKGQFSPTDGTDASKLPEEGGEPVGGDPTDSWVDQVTQDTQLNDEIGDKPYYVDMSSGKPMIKSGNGLTPVQPSKMWTQISPEVIAKATSQGFRQINISVNGQILQGFEGGGKVIVSPADFTAMSSVKEAPSPFPSRNPGTPAAAQASEPAKPVQSAVYPSRNTVKEDDALLEKMRMIAGLR